MSKNTMSAVTFRRLLIGALVLLIVLSSFGFYLLGGLLKDVATESNHKKIDATAGRNDVEQLQRLETYLNDNKDSVTRASEIVADTKEYRYQNQIVSDINTYASRAGVTILGFSFSGQAAPNTDPKQPLAASGTSGVKSIPVTLTLKTPVSYTSFLRLLKSIEQNLTKMQVNGITISPDPTSSSRVSNPTIGLEVYVR